MSGRAWWSIVIALCVVAAGVLAFRAAFSGPSASSAELSLQQKQAIIKEYYADISNGQLDDAHGLLTPGFQSAEDFRSWYRDVAQMDVTTVADVADPNSVWIRVLATAKDGRTAVYSGTVSFAYDDARKQWLIARRGITRTQGAAIVGPLPTPTAAAPAEPQSIDLADLDASSGLAYNLAGKGNSALLSLRLQNKTERTWLVHVHKGTRLDPENSSAQSMVVTEDTEISIEPHDHQTVEIQVACLDIAKAPPAETDTSWRVSSSNALERYLTCANSFVDNKKQADVADAEGWEAARYNIVQVSLWAARGASRDDWISFWHHYHGLDPEQAAQLADKIAEFAQAITEQCGSLT